MYKDLNDVQSYFKELLASLLKKMVVVLVIVVLCLFLFCFLLEDLLNVV